MGGLPAMIVLRMPAANPATPGATTLIAIPGGPIGGGIIGAGITGPVGTIVVFIIAGGRMAVVVFSSDWLAIVAMVGASSGLVSPISTYCCTSSMFIGLATVMGTAFVGKLGSQHLQKR